LWANLKIILTVTIVSVLIIPYPVSSINEPEPVSREGGSTEEPMVIKYYYSEDFEGYNIGDPIDINVTAAVPPPGLPSGSVLPPQTTGNISANLLIDGYYLGNDMGTSAPKHAYVGGWVYMASVARFDLLLYDLGMGATMIEVTLQNDNNVYHWPGGAYTQIPGVTWNLNTWYELFVEYDETAFTYSVWWDGVEYASGSPMIAGTNIDAMIWFGDVGVDAYIDNIHHWEDVPPVHNIDTDMYYPTIQLAINNLNTQDGHTIEVMPGTYNENVWVHKSLTIIGLDKNTTIIDGGGVGDVVEVTADGVTITGFTVQNAGPNEGNRDAAVKLTGVSNCHIFGNIITENTWLGIHLESGGIFNLIENNYCSNNRYGIYIETNSNTVLNNTFFNGYRGLLSWGTGNLIMNNDINLNEIGMLFSPASGNTVAENLIRNNNWSVAITAAGINNKIYHNNFINNNNSAWDEAGGNDWDNGYPSGGNYWDDYVGNDFFSGPLQDIPGSDGIGDTPYIFTLDQDDYPFMVPWPQVPPTVDLTTPDGGEIWMGGSSQNISWTMSDSFDPIDALIVDLEYSTNGAAGPWTPIALGLTGFPGNPCSYNWNPVVSVDSTAVRVRVTVTSTGALSAQDMSLGDFEIDSTAPAPVTNIMAELTYIYEGTNHVDITWDASPSMDVDHYEIYYIANNWDPTGASYNFLADKGLLTSHRHSNVGNMNPSSYFWQVRTYDVAGHETRTTIQAGKIGSTQSIFANPSGWFLLGYHLEVVNTTVEYVIQTLNVDHVMLFRNGVWLHWASYWPPSQNTLTDIYQGEGFWVHLTGNGRFCLAGRITDLAIPLKAGWNCVAYPYATRQMTTANIMADLTSSCPCYEGPIYIMDPSAPYLIAPATGTETLGHGPGFWVKATTDCMWTVTNY